MTPPIIAVLAGGTSPEREVSLGSGRAVALAMAYTHPTQFFTVEADALPPGLDPVRHIVCSTLHGVFGEDGGMQRLLIVLVTLVLILGFTATSLIYRLRIAPLCESFLHWISVAFGY